MKEENPHRVSRRNNNGGTHCQNDAVAEESRKPDKKCSGKRCRSFAAGAIADCVALCCCPCAILNILTLTFVKVPWMIGRRCLGRSRKKNKKRRGVLHRRRRRGRINGGEDGFHHHRRRYETAEEDEKECGVGGGGCCGVGGSYDDHRFVVERDGSLTKEEEEEKTGENDDESTRISARVEAERVWLELYQIGHLGFGRVSFTGIH